MKDCIPLTSERETGFIRKSMLQLHVCGVLRLKLCREFGVFFQNSAVNCRCFASYFVLTLTYADGQV